MVVEVTAIRSWRGGEEARRRRRRRRRKVRRAILKSINPHLAGGEKKQKTTQCLNQSWTSIDMFFFCCFFGVFGFFCFCDIQLPAYTASSLVCIRYISKLAHQATSHYQNLKANPPNSCAKILPFLL